MCAGALASLASSRIRSKSSGCALGRMDPKTDSKVRVAGPSRAVPSSMVKGDLVSRADAQRTRRTCAGIVT